MLQAGLPDGFQFVDFPRDSASKTNLFLFRTDLVSLARIENVHKKRAHDKESRLATVIVRMHLILHSTLPTSYKLKTCTLLTNFGQYTSYKLLTNLRRIYFLQI